MSEASLRAAIPHHVQDSPCKPIYEQLVGIKDSLTRIKDAKPTHTVEELAAYREKLKEIDDARGAGGIFGGGLSHEEGASKIPAGQAECSEELASAYTLLESLTDTAVPAPESVSAIHKELAGIRRSLLGATKHGGNFDSSLPGEIDACQHLRRLQGQLDRIDRERIEAGGMFGGSLATGEIPQGQAMLSEMLAECYGLVAQLQQSNNSGCGTTAEVSTP